MDEILGVEVVFPCPNLLETLTFLIEELGFRLHLIFPADSPTVAVVRGHGVCLRLEEGEKAPLTDLRLLCKNPKAFAKGSSEIVAPNGTKIAIVEADPPIVLPVLKPSLVLQRKPEDREWRKGRAGMLYRDLIPDRQGGRFIASHIRILEGGSVPDYVHFHKVRFQMLYCYRGWVSVLYEDQGGPILVQAGDCVLQPPEIRHRVVQSSPGFEVIEISCPAEHETFADHNMELPTPIKDPDRKFNGQTFVHHQGFKSIWFPWGTGGFEYQDTGIGKATDNLAGARVVRVLSGEEGSHPSYEYQHEGELLFLFVLQGEMEFKTAALKEAETLRKEDCCVILPGSLTSVTAGTSDLEFLEVSMPAICVQR